MPYDLQFTDNPHGYTLNGRPVPSVTQILDDVVPGWHASEWYLQRGTAVHACAAMIARGQTFRHDPQIDGQVEACRRFFREVAPAVLEVEARVASVTHQYAGTLDLRATLASKDTIFDWKASIGPATKYQLAGYAVALEDDTGHLPRWGCAVQLREDGYYSMSDMYDLRRLKPGWLVLLGAYRIRRECGITLEGE